MERTKGHRVSKYQPRPTDDAWFNGEAVNSTDLHTAGVGVRIDGIGGWDDDIDVRDTRQPNPGRDGEKTRNQFSSGRTLTIEGFVQGSSFEDLQERKRALANTYAPGTDEHVFKLPDPTSDATGTIWARNMLHAAPLAWWRLGETSGTTAADSSGNGYTGTYVNSPTLGATGALTNDTGKCVDLDGTNDHVSIPYAAALNVQGTSVSAWIKRDVDTGAVEVIYSSLNAAGTSGFELRVNASDKLELAQAVAGAPVATITGTTSLAVGTWYHVAVSFYMTTYEPHRLFVNGEVDGYADHTGNAQNGDTAQYIGARKGTSLFFNGKIQDVALWDQVIDAADFAWLYASGTATDAGDVDTAGYERVEARVTAPIQFGKHIGGHGQEYAVQLRASDPLVYSDVETKVRHKAGLAAPAISYPAKKTRTPAVVSGTLNYNTLGGAILSNESAPSIFTSSAAAFVGPLNSPLGELVVDTKNRDAYIRAPHVIGRVGLMSPVAYWPLNETAGVTADNAQGTAGYDGTFVNAPTLNQAGPCSGTKSVLFDGTNDHVTIPYNAALYPSEWTIEAWYSAAVGATYRPVISFTNAAQTAGVSVSVHPTDGYVWVDFYGASGRQVAGVGAVDVLTPTSWHHFALTYRNGALRLFVDGAEAFATAATFTTPGSGTLYLARKASGGGYFAGNIAGVGIYARALSPAEVAALVDTSHTFNARAYTQPYIGTIAEWPTVNGGEQWRGFNAVPYPVITYREARA